MKHSRRSQHHTSLHHLSWHDVHNQIQCNAYAPGRHRVGHHLDGTWDAPVACSTLSITTTRSWSPWELAYGASSCWSQLWRSGGLRFDAVGRGHAIYRSLELSPTVLWQYYVGVWTTTQRRRPCFLMAVLEWRLDKEFVVQNVWILDNIDSNHSLTTERHIKWWRIVVSLHRVRNYVCDCDDTCNDR